MGTTFGEQRTATEVLIDAIVLHSVKRGIALLEEKHGADWAKVIDLDTLDLASPTSCVLGQVYSDAKVTKAEAERYADSLVGDGDYVTYDGPGYTKGLAIIDGDLIDEEYGAAKYGFLTPGYFGLRLQGASDEELAEDWGVTREMVDAAVAEYDDPDDFEYIEYGYLRLQGEWKDALASKVTA